MKNFDFILQLAEHIPSFKDLHNYCDKAEIFQYSYPEDSATNARRALEWLVKNHLSMAHVTLEPHESLNSMLHRPEIDDMINHDWEFEEHMRNVKKIGNAASHVGSQQVKRNSAFVCLRSLYYVVCGFLYRWRAFKEIKPFDAEQVPKGFAGLQVVSDPEPQVAQDVVASVSQEAIEHPLVPNAMPHESLKSEEITRKVLIDYMLNEAGWDILTTKGDIQGGKACIEVEVQGMNNASGVGYCDYVLMSRGGKPLAVIEAKSTIKEAGVGRHQAEMYADCLEAKYGVRPVIYYTNGYTTKVIDGLGYPDREVIAFHSHDDLEYMIQKRGRAKITDVRIDNAITDRKYQKRAIESLVDWLNQYHRRGLLVLATGTGKTRVSISLCKVLSQNNWVKNVLFLADRTELVGQARKNFEALLPSETMTSLSDDSEPNMHARFMFSTYQTMINYINAPKMLFSVGHFDLIIIDEAHRSVFGKYGAIFRYFDSLLIGLTATPRADIDKNTFELLELDEGEPNFEYTYEEAIDDNYLVPYEAVQNESKLIEEGVKYDELTEDERNELEDVWEYEKACLELDPRSKYYRDIESGEMFKYIINQDTIDAVLEQLMTKGLRVHSGEDIGKTIIFAYNHKHAEEVVSRFHKLYPEKGPDYCQLIDNYVNYRKDLIEKFKVEDKLPQVAVSVDMLDTGIDVPEVLNLVFFKVVKSKIKFLQMIGRGTRLCKNLLGPGEDKTKFYIFDWCGNFKYFSMNPNPVEAKEAMSLTERLFCMRLDIAKELQSADHQKVEFDKQLHDELKVMLHKQVAGIVKERKDARTCWNIIEPFRDKERWTYLSELDVSNLKKIGKLVPQESDDEGAKMFDVIMLRLQLSLLDPTNKPGKSMNKVVNIAAALEKKGTLPVVVARIKTIKLVQMQQFWEEQTLDRLEGVRKELRDLMFLLIDGPGNQKFVVNIKDDFTSEIATPIMPTTYKQRVLDYLSEHADNPTLTKIQNFEQLTQEDIDELERIFFEQLGSQEEYDKLTEGRPYKNNVAAFVRVINGIDRHKALAIYHNFVDSYDMTADQERYLKDILDYVSVNGDIRTENFMDYPLKELNWRGTFGDNFISLKGFVKQIHQVISIA